MYQSARSAHRVMYQSARSGIFRIPILRSLVRILRRAIFFQPEKPGFSTVFVEFGCFESELPFSVVVSTIYSVLTNRFPNIPFSDPPCTLFPTPPVLETTTELTPMSRKCTLCTYRYKTTLEARKTGFFLRFARVTLTGRQISLFWTLHENFPIIKIIK